MVSDGTLRLLALTILANLRSATGIYLVEEPENGIHPTAVETVYQSLSSVYDGQVLVATHSPVMLAISSPEQLLCFARLTMAKWMLFAATSTRPFSSGGVSAGPRSWELLVLTADKNTQFAIEGLLSRHAALGIRPIHDVKILVHPRRDPAVFRESHDFLRPFQSLARYCLVVFALERSGGKNRSREELEEAVQSNLDANGWQGCSAVIAIAPELEA
jgi:hypothetical protein